MNIKGESPDPVAEVDEAMREVLALFPAAPVLRSGQRRRRRHHDRRTGQDLDALLPSLRRLVEGGAGR
jgi:hypothetical protein